MHSKYQVAQWKLELLEMMQVFCSEQIVHIQVIQQVHDNVASTHNSTQYIIVLVQVVLLVETYWFEYYTTMYMLNRA